MVYALFQLPSPAAANPTKPQGNFTSCSPSFETLPTHSSRRAIVFLERGEAELTWETIDTQADDSDDGDSD